MIEYYKKKFNYRQTIPEEVCLTCKYSYKRKSDYALRYPESTRGKTLLKCPLQPKGVVTNKHLRARGRPERDATVGSRNVCDRWEAKE